MLATMSIGLYIPVYYTGTSVLATMCIGVYIPVYYIGTPVLVPGYLYSSQYGSECWCERRCVVLD